MQSADISDRTPIELAVLTEGPPIEDDNNKVIIDGVLAEQSPPGSPPGSPEEVVEQRLVPIYASYVAFRHWLVVPSMAKD